jgi:DNA-binding CsgD family transcriptional regulator
MFSVRRAIPLANPVPDLRTARFNLGTNRSWSNGLSMQSLFLAFWQRLRANLGFQPATHQSLPLGKELLQSLEQLAASERRSQDEVIADLLTCALAQRQAAEVNLRRWRELSPRERQVAALICLDLTNRQIAGRLKISPETVKTHVRHILEKFQARSKLALRLMLSDWDFSDWHDINPN